MRETGLQSIDFLRGLVMIAMALDHVREFFTNAQFSPTDLSATTGPYFMTRRVTRFCAQVFSLLTGVGAFLWYSRGRSKGGTEPVSAGARGMADFSRTCGDPLLRLGV